MKFNFKRQIKYGEVVCRVGEEGLDGCRWWGDSTCVWGVGKFPFLRNTINSVSLTNICRLLGHETHEIRGDCCLLGPIHLVGVGTPVPRRGRGSICPVWQQCDPQIIPRSCLQFGRQVRGRPDLPARLRNERKSECWWSQCIFKLIGVTPLGPFFILCFCFS